MPEIKELLGKESLLAIKDYVDTKDSGKEDKENKTTILSDASTDIQYPSAKVVYDKLQLKSNATNLENGTGENSLQQKQDGTSGTFDFTNKNPNATALDPTLTGQIAYGGAGNFATSFGGKSQASGKRSFAQGTTTIAKGKYSHAEGDNSVAYGDDSHAEGFATLSAGLASHTEGTKTQVLTTLPESGGGGDTPVDPPAGFLPDDHRGEASHAEGSLTAVYGFSSHAEGANTIVKGHYAHAEGVSTMAVGAGSKSYGNHSTANGDYSVAGGSYTTANQIGSFAHGYGASTYAEYSTAFGDNTQTVRRAQFVTGIYNTGKTTTLFEVGNGSSSSRSNAFEVYEDGHATVGNKTIAVDENVVHKTGDEPITSIKTFDGNGEIRFKTNPADVYYGYIKESSRMVLDIADMTVNVGGSMKTVVGTSSNNIELDNNLLPGSRTNVIIFHDSALNSDQSDTNSATYIFPTRNKTSGSTYTLATDEDVVHKTGDETNITGVKGFYSLITLGGPGGSYPGANDIGGIVFKGVSGLSSSATTLKAHTNGTSGETYSLLLPDKSDTLAVLGDIPHLYQHRIKYTSQGNEITFVILNTTSTSINTLDLCKEHIGDFRGAHGFFKSSSSEYYPLEVTSISTASYIINFTYSKVTTEATVDLTSVSPYPNITDAIRKIF